jgi:acetoin utilization protein AcuA
VEFFAAVKAANWREIHLTERIAVQTPMGKLSVYTFASPDEIRQLSFDGQFGEHPDFRSLYTRSASLIRRAAEEDANVVLAVTDKENIIGFGVLAYPEPDQRWARLEPKVMMEIKAIEVSRDWRQMGVGSVLVKGMLSHPRVEEKIIYFVGFTWTWDLRWSKITASQYRKMMIRLFQPFQFNECKTNEPNICLDADNLFMCRIGKDISDSLLDDFKWLSFGVYNP